MNIDVLRGNFKAHSLFRLARGGCSGNIIGPASSPGLEYRRMIKGTGHGTSNWPAFQTWTADVLG